jgi:glycosyltransferase involved in cell wall biosynthesis
LRIAFLGDGSLNHIQRWVSYFHQHGHRVILISFEPVAQTDFETRRIYPRFPTKLLGYIFSLPRVREILDSFQPHILNSLYLSGYGLIGSLSGYHPLVASALGSDLLVDYKKHWIHRLQIKRVIREADLIITDGENLSRKAASIGGEPDKIVKVYFGIDQDLFYPSPHQPTLEEEEEQSFRIISTRNFYPVYDIRTLVKAADRIKENLNAQFILCGDGPERADIEAEVSRLSIRDSFTFEGTLNNPEIATRLRESSVYVSTSVSDSTSVSLLEAMACGVAPVVTDIPANREWIKHGENGLLFPLHHSDKLAESIIKLYQNRQLIDRFRKKNISIIEERGLWGKNMEIAEKAFIKLREQSRL